MKHLMKYLTALSLMTTACGSIIKVDRRTPLLPTFAEIGRDEYSDSNPFFSSVTQFYDKQEMKLSDSTSYKPTSPTLVSPIGTYYRFSFPVYAYAMTSGLGLQYDPLIWSRSKISLGLFLGYYQNHGVNLAYAHELGRWGSGPVTSYLSVQRRVSRNFVECYSQRGDPCSEESSAGGNSLRMREDTFNPLIGMQFGRFKLGSEGQTTMYFKFEFGYNYILSRHFTHEQYPAAYTHSDGPLVGTEFGFTLW